MASFGEQLKAARVAHLAASSIEDQVRVHIADAFDSWDSGDLNAQTVRYRLEAVVRASYRTSASLAAEHTARQSEIPGWRPQTEIFNTQYLKDLLSDVRRNLRDYKASDQDEKARRRAILRMQHSAGVGAQRGFTDALIASYAELSDFGYEIKKVWLANFNNNTPCEHCRRLHGTVVKLNDEFPITERSPGVYVNLQGPPRHPRCRCYLTMLVVTLENAFEELNIEDPGPPQETMDTEGVQRLPFNIFSAILGALKKIVSFVTGV